MIRFFPHQKSAVGCLSKRRSGLGKSVFGEIAIPVGSQAEQMLHCDHGIMDPYGSIWIRWMGSISKCSPMLTQAHPNIQWIYSNLAVNSHITCFFLKGEPEYPNHLIGMNRYEQQLSETAPLWDWEDFPHSHGINFLCLAGDTLNNLFNIQGHMKEQETHEAFTRVLHGSWGGCE